MPCSSVSASSSGTGLLQIQQSRSPKIVRISYTCFLKRLLFAWPGLLCSPIMVAATSPLVNTWFLLSFTRPSGPFPPHTPAAYEGVSGAPEQGGSREWAISVKPAFRCPPLVARSCYWGPLLGHSNLSPLSYRLSAKRRCDCNRLLSKASLTGVGRLPSGEAMGIWGLSDCSSRGEVRQADRTGLNSTAISGLLIQVVHFALETSCWKSGHSVRRNSLLSLDEYARPYRASQREYCRQKRTCLWPLGIDFLRQRSESFHHFARRNNAIN